MARRDTALAIRFAIIVGILSVAVAVAGGILYLAWSAVGAIEPTTTNTVQEYFILRFIGLLVIGMITWIFLWASITWVIPRVNGSSKKGRPVIGMITWIFSWTAINWLASPAEGVVVGHRPTFVECLERICDRFTGTGGSDNNFRWEFLATLTIFTILMAFGHPGEPLWSGTFQSANGTPLTTTLVKAWNVFYYGNNAPAITIPPPAPPVPKATWFWWQASLSLILITFVYFFFAFYDEVHLGIKKVIEVIQRERSKARERRGDGGGAPAAAGATRVSAPDSGGRFLQLLSVEMVGEMLSEFIKVVFKGYVARKEKRATS